MAANIKSLWLLSLGLISSLFLTTPVTAAPLICYDAPASQVNLWHVPPAAPQTKDAVEELWDTDDWAANSQPVLFFTRPNNAREKSAVWYDNVRDWGFNNGFYTIERPWKLPQETAHIFDLTQWSWSDDAVEKVKEQNTYFALVSRVFAEHVSKLDEEHCPPIALLMMKSANGVPETSSNFEKEERPVLKAGGKTSIKLFEVDGPKVNNIPDIKAGIKDGQACTPEETTAWVNALPKDFIL